MTFDERVVLTMWNGGRVGVDTRPPPSRCFSGAANFNDQGVAPSTGRAGGQLVTLDPKKRVACELIEKETLSHDTRRLRFALPSVSPAPHGE